MRVEVLCAHIIDGVLRRRSFASLDFGANKASAHEQTMVIMGIPNELYQKRVGMFKMTLPSQLIAFRVKFIGYAA